MRQRSKIDCDEVALLEPPEHCAVTRDDYAVVEAHAHVAAVRKDETGEKQIATDLLEFSQQLGR